MDKTSIVHSTSSSSCNIIPATKLNSSFAAKLRRLKIEESILMQNINKSVSYHTTAADNEKASTNFVMFSEFKKFCDKTKTSYNELKQLFQDIQASTSSKEVLKTIDIDDIKNNTLELETKIKSFKSYLNTELYNLKSTERLLNQNLNDPVSMKYLKTKPRVQTAKYTEIVPSPVKTLMTSPFKCSEVQEFQEFMKNSKNRYGGWDEYHHNIFVNLWQKYCCADKENEFSDDNKSIFENQLVEYDSFLRELMPKLLGVSEDEIIAHMKWYTKYLKLKDRQQRVINKWRSNRKMMKPSNNENDAEKDNIKNKQVIKNRRSHSDNTNKKDDLHFEKIWQQGNDKVRSFVRKCYSDERFLQLEYNMNDEMDSEFESYESEVTSNLHYLKATKQWHIKCSSKDTKADVRINNVENITKRGSPFWRAGL